MSDRMRTALRLASVAFLALVAGGVIAYLVSDRDTSTEGAIVQEPVGPPATTPEPELEPHIDEATTVRLRLPVGWRSERRENGTLWIWDPASSSDDTADTATTGFQIAVEEEPTGDLAEIVTTRLHGDPSYRWVSSNPATFDDLEAFRHEYTFTQADTPLYVIELFVKRPSRPGELVHISAYTAPEAPEAEKELVRRTLEEGAILR